MLEVAQNLEQVAVRFSPIVLILPGLAAVALGLFIWLGGLGCRKILCALAGAIVGATCGLLIIGRNIIAAVCLTVPAALIATIFESIFTKILAAALAALLAFAVLARPYIGNPQALALNQVQSQAEPLDIRQSLRTVKAHTSDLRTEIKNLCSRLPTISWVIIAALSAIAIIAESLLWRITSALCWAALGTIIIFAGMISLLLYKGTAPITAIVGRTYFYTAVFAAMVAFGTIEQLLLCQHTKRLLTGKKIAAQTQAGTP